MNSLDTRFAQRLYDELVKELNDAHHALANGSQIIREDASATGMNCAKYIGVISGLELAMTHMKRIDADMGGKKLEEL